MEGVKALDPENEAALVAFNRVLSFNPADILALRGAAAVLRRTDDRDCDDQEVRHLELLDDLTELPRSDLSRLGYLKYRTAAYFDAIEYWRRALTKGPPQAYLCFNIGLAYNQKIVSQDADAVDMWRRALSIDSGYVRAHRELDRVVPRLLKLAATARRTGDTVLDLNQWYATYLNPFELLGLDESTSPFDVDERYIQKLKRALLHEIALEEGDLRWLPGRTVERSRAITLVDELNHPRLRKHHALIFSDKRLLAFLSRGDHEHFLVDPETSSLELIDEIDRNADFREWLSIRFVSQYDRVLATAIQQQKLPAIECLLDGRRWVLPSQQDDCFQRARREVARLVEPLTEARREVEGRKPSFDSVDQVLGSSNIVPILNLLPTYFESQQNAAVEEIRNLAVACFNTHGDSALSLQILELTRRFQFKSSRLNQLLNKDFEQVRMLIRQERKHEVHVTHNDEVWEITKEGVRKGTRFVPSTDILGVRWGALAAFPPSVQGSDARLGFVNYTVMFRTKGGGALNFSWMDADEGLREILSKAKYMSKARGKDRNMFRDMLEACLSYVLPHVQERIQAQMNRRESVKIGPYVLTTEGVGVMTRRWMFRSLRQVPWYRVDVQIRHGVVTVTDRQRTRVRVSCNIHETENVVVLSALVEKHGKIRENG